MKKIFSLALALGMVASSFAQVQVNQDMSKNFKSMTRHQVSQMRDFQSANHIARQAVYNSNKLEVRNAANMKQAAQQVAAATADTALWLAAYNCFRGGYFPDGWEANPMLLHQWNDSVTFVNLSVSTGDAFGWFLNGMEVSTDTNLVMAGVEMFDDNDQAYTTLPELQFENGASYFMGDAWKSTYETYYPSYEWSVYWCSLPKTYAYPLTFCDFYSSADMTGSKIGWNLDYWIWSATDKAYMWGSNFDISSEYSKYGFTKRCDTICSPFGMTDIELAIDTITLAFYSIGTTLPAGSGVTIDLYPVSIDAQGYALIDTQTKLASYTATAADTVGTYSYTVQGLDDPVITGVLTFPIKKTIRGMFAAEISGFNNNNANIGFFADYLSYGTTYHVINGNYISAWYTNLAISFNATATCTTDMPEVKASANAAAQKAIKNGQLVIAKDGRFFNALGAEIK